MVLSDIYTWPCSTLLSIKVFNNILLSSSCLDHCYPLISGAPSPHQTLPVVRWCIAASVGFRWMMCLSSILSRFGSCSSIAMPIKGGDCSPPVSSVTVDGSEIRLTSWGYQVGSLSHYFTGFCTSKVVAGFFPFFQYLFGVMCVGSDNNCLVLMKTCDMACVITCSFQPVDAGAILGELTSWRWSIFSS